MDKMLYIVRGLPGSGKSTLARTLSEELNAPHYEEDMWLYHENGDYEWSPLRMDRAVKLCQYSCEKLMNEGHFRNIVISNVFGDADQLAPYQRMADRHGYDVTYIVVENRRGGMNIHNVPNDALDEMRENFEVSL